MIEKKRLPRNSILSGVGPALLRAAKAAQLLARQTNTPCYVIQDGKLVDLTQQEAAARAARPESVP